MLVSTPPRECTAPEWVTRLTDAHHAGRLQDELRRLGRYPLLVVDEVGYVPFEPEAANVFFQLVSSRYERASLIVTNNKPFGRWGRGLRRRSRRRRHDRAAMIDRLIHHAEVISLEGDSYRLKDRDLGRPHAAATEDARPRGGQFSAVARGQLWAAVDTAPSRLCTKLGAPRSTIRSCALAPRCAQPDLTRLVVDLVLISPLLGDLHRDVELYARAPSSAPRSGTDESRASPSCARGHKSSN